MSRGIFLSIKDIQRITGKSYSGAWRYIQLIKDSIGKEKKQNITIKEYCKYEGIDEKELQGIL